MSNNAFFSLNGSIDRKNYIINMLILISIFIGLQFLNIETFRPYLSFDLIYTILAFFIGTFQFLAMMSMSTVIYRRIVDFSVGRSSSFFIIMRRIYIFMFFIPILYALILRYYLDLAPGIIEFLDLLLINFIIPIDIIMAIVFAFLKGKVKGSNC